MRLSKEKNKEILGNVRREMVKKPDITIFELQDILNQHYHHTFDKNFIGKLKSKIHKERAHRVNQTIGYELALLEDVINEVSKILWDIINSPETSNREKISAIRELRSAKSTLLEAMLNSGIFERQFSKPKTDSDISPESRELIAKALSYVFNPEQPTKLDDNSDN